jgi:autotransporter-associated beta strand protein
MAAASADGGSGFYAMGYYSNGGAANAAVTLANTNVGGGASGQAQATAGQGTVQGVATASTTTSTVAGLATSSAFAVGGAGSSSTATATTAIGAATYSASVTTVSGVQAYAGTAAGPVNGASILNGGVAAQAGATAAYSTIVGNDGSAGFTTLANGLKAGTTNVAAGFTSVAGVGYLGTNTSNSVAGDYTMTADFKFIDDGHGLAIGFVAPTQQGTGFYVGGYSVLVNGAFQAGDPFNAAGQPAGPFFTDHLINVGLQGYVGLVDVMINFGVTNRGPTDKGFAFSYLVGESHTSLPLIDTLRLASDVNAGTVLPAFRGGTLQIDQANMTLAQIFTVNNQTATVDTHANTATFSGGFTNDVVGSGGTLVFTGGGTAILTAANTYAGGTQIDAGTQLQLGDGVTASTFGQGAVLDNGLITFNGPGLANVGNLISGSGAVNIVSGGIVYTADNTYSGATTIASGTTLQLGNGAVAGGFGSGAVVDNGHLVFDLPAAPTPIANLISGSGDVALATGSWVTFIGANTYHGGTTINVGAELDIGDGVHAGAMGSGAVTDNGFLEFQNPGTTTFANAISGSGKVFVQGAGNVILTGADTWQGLTGISGVSTLQVGDGVHAGGVGLGDVDVNGTLVFDNPGASTFGNRFYGAGVAMKVLGGQVILTNTNSAFSGPVTVSGGSLQIGAAPGDGSFLSATGGVSVAAAGRLGGFGSLGGAVVNNGVVSPGAGGVLGRLTIGGDYTQSATGMLSILAGPSQTSNLQVGGAAHLNGGLTVAFTPGAYAPFTTYKIVGATGAVSGTFSTVSGTTGLPFGLGYDVSYLAHEVDLALRPNPGLGSVFSDQQLIAGGDAGLFFGQVLDHDLEAAEGRKAKGGQAANTYGTANCAADGFCGPSSVWLKPMASRSVTDSAGPSSGYGADAAGLVGGIDRDVGQFGRVGLAMAYSHDNVGYHGAASSHGDSYDIAAYGHAVAGPAHLDGLIAYTDAKTSLDRHTSSGEANSGPHARGWGAAAQIGVPYAISRTWTLTPEGRLSVFSQHQDSYAETGAGVSDLTVASFDQTSVKARFDLRLTGQIAAASGAQLRPELRVGVEEELGSPAHSVSAIFSAAPAAPFAVLGVRPDRTAAVIGAGLSGSFRNCLDLYARIDGRFSRDQSEGAATLGARWRF